MSPVTKGPTLEQQRAARALKDAESNLNRALSHIAVKAGDVVEGLDEYIRQMIELRDAVSHWQTMLHEYYMAIGAMQIANEKAERGRGGGDGGESGQTE